MYTPITRKVAHTYSQRSAELRKRHKLTTAPTRRDFTDIHSDIGEREALTDSHQCAAHKEETEMEGGAFEDTADCAKDGADDDGAETAEAVSEVAGDCCWDGAAEHDQRDGETAHGR